MALSPFAAASTAGSVKAPYAGAVFSGANYQSAAACAKVKNTVPAHWNATTGKGGFSEYASASSCATQLGNAGTDSYATAEGVLFVDVPVTIATNGIYHLRATWSLNIANVGTRTVGTCAKTTAKFADCFVGFVYELGAFAALVDVTNGSSTYPSAVCWQTGCSSGSFWYALNDTGNTTYWSSGTLSYYNSTYTYQLPGNHLTYFLNTTSGLVATHGYVVELYFYDYIGASAGAYSTYQYNASASMTSNAASLGHFVKLSGVSWR